MKLNDQIQQLRKDWLLLLQNVPKVQTVQQANYLRQGFRHWSRMLEDISDQANQDFKGYVRSRASGAETFTAMYRVLNDFYHAAKDSPEVPTIPEAESVENLRKRLLATPGLDPERVEGYLLRNPPETKEQLEQKALTEWQQKVTKWNMDARRKAQEAWKMLQLYQEWTSGHEKPWQYHVLKRENQTVQGFACQFVYYDEQDILDVLPSIQTGLNRYRSQAQKAYPWLLQHPLPLVFRMDTEGGTSSGAMWYEGDHIEIGYFGMRAKPDEFAHYVAHEMGHHIYQKQLSPEQQTFWHRALRGDYQTLKLQSILDQIGSGETLREFERRIERTDPILHLQLELLFYDPAYRDYGAVGVQGIKDLMAKGVREIRVPTHPITGYASKNTEEAFCETLGLLVGYGPQAVHAEVKKWFWLMQPGVRMASRGGVMSLIEKVAETWTKQADDSGKQIALMKFLSAEASKLGVADSVYIVGGAVRNFVLGIPPKDLDVVVDSVALKGRDSAWFAERLQFAIPAETSLVTNQYGVAIITIKGTWMLDGHDLKGEVVEIANARKESYGKTDAGKGYKPDSVEPATIQEDVVRREFTFNCMAGDTLIPTEKGILRIDQIASRGDGNQQNINLVVAGQDGPAIAVGWQYSGCAPTLRVATEWGHSFSCTHHHPVLVLRGHDHEWVQADQIEEGDLLCVPVRQVTRQQPLSLGLPDPVKPKQGGLKEVRKPEVMTPELAFVIGCVVAEGSNTYKTVSFSNSDPAFIARYVECFHASFGFQPSHNKVAEKGSVRVLHGVKFVANADCYDIYANSKTVVGWLDALGLYCGGRKGGKSASHYKVIPWSILQADERSQWAFLAAYLEGDGSIQPDTGRITFCSASPYVRQQMQVLLGAHGILSKVKDRFVYINAVDSALLWGKIHPWMVTKRFDFTQRGFKSRNRFGIPKDYLQGVLWGRRVRVGNNQGPSVYRTDRGDEVALRGVLEALRLPKLLLHDAYARGDFNEFMASLQVISQDEHTKLQRLFDLGYQYVEVTSIEDAGQQDVFDLSMGEGVEPAFVANGLVVHNTLLWRLSEVANGPDRNAILDITGCGMQDLKDGLMRCPSDPDQTFSDDPSRMIRLIKFLLKYGFKPTPDVEAAVRRNRFKLQNMPGSHLSNQIITLFYEQGVGKRALLEMAKLGLLEVIHKIAQDNRPFREALANWAERHAEVQFLFDLMDLGMPVGKSLNYLNPGQKNRVREITVEMDADQGAQFVQVLEQPGKVLDMPALIADFELKGAEIRKLMEVSRTLLLDKPSYVKDRQGWEGAIRKVFQMNKTATSSKVMEAFVKSGSSVPILTGAAVAALSDAAMDAMLRGRDKMFEYVVHPKAPPRILNGLARLGFMEWVGSDPKDNHWLVTQKGVQYLLEVKERSFDMARKRLTGKTAIIHITNATDGNTPELRGTPGLISSLTQYEQAVMQDMEITNEPIRKVDTGYVLRGHTVDPDAVVELLAAGYLESADGATIVLSSLYGAKKRLYTAAYRPGSVLQRLAAYAKKRWGGFTFKIDRPKGFVKTWPLPDGEEKKYTYPVDYGYFVAHEGEDGEGLDAFVGNDPEGPIESFLKLKPDEKDPKKKVPDETKFLIGLTPAERKDVLKLYGEGELIDHKVYTDMAELVEVLSEFRSVKKVAAQALRLAAETPPWFPQIGDTVTSIENGDGWSYLHFSNGNPGLDSMIGAPTDSRRSQGWKAASKKVTEDTKVSGWAEYRKTEPIKAVQMDEDFEVETLEGTMKGKKGDWLAEGVEGERWPIDKAIFDKTYEKVARAKEAGWWSISTPKGGVSTEDTGQYGGDGPADILDVAIREITEEWQQEWGRDPTVSELDAAWNFVTGPAREK